MSSTNLIYTLQLTGINCYRLNIVSCSVQSKSSSTREIEQGLEAGFYKSNYISDWSLNELMCVRIEYSRVLISYKRAKRLCDSCQLVFILDNFFPVKRLAVVLKNI